MTLQVCSEETRYDPNRETMTSSPRRRPWRRGHSLYKSSLCIDSTNPASSSLAGNILQAAHQGQHGGIGQTDASHTHQSISGTSSPAATAFTCRALPARRE